MNLFLSRDTQQVPIRHSIVASIPACQAGDQGSIPCDGDFFSIARDFNIE